MSSDANPQDDGPSRVVSAPGLDGDVEVLRDRHGVAHVRAGSVHDAFYAQGYLSALDRGPQMEYDRRRALGRWAQVVGPGAVGDDVFIRRIGLAAAARRSFAALDQPTRAALTAYAAGVNTIFAAGLPDAPLLPEPPDLWEPWHSCAVYLGRHVWMGSLSHKLFRTALLPSMPADLVWRLRANAREELAVVPPGMAFRSAADGPGPDWGDQLAGWLGVARDDGDDDASTSVSVSKSTGAGAGESVRKNVAAQTGQMADGFGLAIDPSGGSNNWAVSGQRTVTGHPLLAGDPHRPLETPGPYWQNHLSCDAFDVIGLAFPGVPGFPHFGHNAHVAWSITHGMADDQDLYIEQLAGLPVRTETIEVSGAEPVEVEIRESPRGGLIAQDEAAGIGLALRWTGTAEPDPTMNCLLPMLTATSADEFDEAMRSWVVPADNLLMADTSGAVRYRLRGRLPERAEANGWAAVPGWDAQYAWTGWVPFEQMPVAVDPPEGFLVSANNRPKAADAPYVAHDFSSPARASRILELLRSAEQLDRAAMERIHADVTSPAALEFLELLGDAQCETAPQLVELLKAWDGRMTVDSVAASVYITVRQELLSVINLPQLPGKLDQPLLPPARLATTLWLSFPGLLAQVRAQDTAMFPDWSAAVSQALDRAAKRLIATLGPDLESWTWGRLHQAVFAPIMPGVTPIGSRPVPGDNETVRAGGVRGLTHTASSSGSVARYVFDLGDWENSGWVVPEQTEEWYDARLVPMHYAWSTVLADAGPATWLSPRMPAAPESRSASQSASGSTAREPNGADL
jgi:penicillin amidase